MNQNENSMIYKFFETQWKTKKPKDWICTVQQNLKHLGFEETFKEIKNMKKSTLKRMLNKAISKRAFERLIEMKEKHSKLDNLKYSNLKMQNYLKPSRVKATQNEIETIFKMRSRMTDVKLNFRRKYENLDCRACNQEEESQKHLYECLEILKNKEIKTKMMKYDQIFGENSRNQVEIAKQFLENIEIRNTLK